METSKEINTDEMEENSKDEMNEQDQVQIEVRELNNVERERGVNEVNDLRTEVLKKVLIEFDEWLSIKQGNQLRRLIDMDSIDIIITFLSDVINSWYGRLKKLQTTMSTLDRIMGTGRGGGGMSLRNIESLLAERLYQSLAGTVTQTVESQAEAQRRKTLAEEVLSRYLKDKGDEVSEDKGGGK